VRTRSLVYSFVAMVLIAVLSIGATVLTGKSPLLGLDLKGGVSVTERPEGAVNSNILQEAVDIMDRRVNGTGVSNSSVTVQGSDIVIELPGAKNDTQVLSFLGETAQLFFRPVDCIIPALYVPPSTTPSATPTGTTTTVPGAKAKAAAKAKSKTAPGGSTSTSKPAKAAAGFVGHLPLAHLDAHLASTSYPVAAAASHTSVPSPKGASSSTSSTVASTTVPKSAAATTTTTTTPANVCNASATAQAEYDPPNGNKYGVTPSQDDNANDTVVLPNYSGYAAGRYVLAPAEMSGNIVKSATADLDSQTDEWEVVLDFTGAGSTAFNKYAAAHYACYKQNESNPPYCALQAIELDGTVESAPSIDSNNFPGSAQISGSSSAPFTQQEAQSLAQALSYGSLPVRFVAQDIDNISPQIGTDSLKAGAVAGGIAVLLVLIYLIIYYRALGLVVVIGIAVSGALLYSITTLLSYTDNLTLTLSGVIGLIVSVGVTADSCVVYFERLKEEIRAGRTVRTSVEKGFKRAFRTVLAADFSSFIGALILYALTVGDVRGFAFFLGLATLLNVVTTYFFTRPLVVLIGRRSSVGEAGFLSVSRGLGAGALAQ
jgi:preprotein translocase subunit SecD